MFNPSMISSRVYTSTGRKSLRSLRDGMLITLMLTVNKKWDPTNRFESKIKTWIVDYAAETENFKIDLESAIQRLDDDKFNRYEPFYQTVVENEVNSFTEPKNIVQDGLQSFKKRIEDIKQELLAESKIDNEKLKQIGIWSSSKAFDNLHKKFPFTFLMSIRFL